jgi:serine kinase of HPr protein (carbohydrate metabolism regulator)
MLNDPPKMVHRSTSAVSNFILKDEGYNSTTVFKQRLHDLLARNNEEEKKHHG